jgi:hypothetical protein
MYRYFIGDSGQTTLYASVRRDVDSYIYNNVAGAFQNGTQTGLKAITVTAISGYPGLYSSNINPALWDDGKYQYAVQDSGNAHSIVAAEEFQIVDGEECTLGTISESIGGGTTGDAYYADIDFNIDSNNSLDEYTVGWFKNGNIVEAGITSPLLHSMTRSGVAILNNVTMSGVANGVYKYDAPQTIARGESYIVTVRATIDGSQRASRKIIGRDN